MSRYYKATVRRVSAAQADADIILKETDLFICLISEGGQ
jgi:hypothetical protein